MMTNKPKPIGEVFKKAVEGFTTDKRFITLVAGKPCYPAPKTPRDRSLIHRELRDTVSKLVMGVSPWPLFIYGGAGSGKTCAALCMHDLYGGWYTTLGEMVELYWAAHRGELMTASGYQWGLLEVKDIWSHCRLAIIDEIGEREEVSPAHYEVTKRLIDWRLRDGPTPAVYLSNRDLDELQRIYGDPVSSRLAAGTVVRLHGDRRQGEKVTFEVSSFS